MGAAASATRNVLVEKLPKCTDYEKAFEHLHQHNIQGDGIDFDTFKEGILLQGRTCEPRCYEMGTYESVR